MSRCRAPDAQGCTGDLGEMERRHRVQIAAMYGWRSGSASLVRRLESIEACAVVSTK